MIFITGMFIYLSVIHCFVAFYSQCNFVAKCTERKCTFLTHLTSLHLTLKSILTNEKSHIAVTQKWYLIPVVINLIILFLLGPRNRIIRPSIRYIKCASAREAHPGWTSDSAWEHDKTERWGQLEIQANVSLVFIYCFQGIQNIKQCSLWPETGWGIFAFKKTVKHYCGLIYKLHC